MSSSESVLERTDEISFEHKVCGIGTFALRPLSLPDDTALIYDWVTQERARFWNMRDKSRQEVETFYRDLMASGHATAYLGLLDGAPMFLIEVYDPAHDQVGGHYPVQAGDRGMHFLIAPPTRRIAGFSHAVISTIMELLFSDPSVRRVVVEPDVRNDKIHDLNRKVGFVYDKEIELKEKTAHLAFCTREQYAAAVRETAR